jgi:polyphosphate kinase
VLWARCGSAAINTRFVNIDDVGVATFLAHDPARLMTRETPYRRPRVSYHRPTPGGTEAGNLGGDAMTARSAKANAGKSKMKRKSYEKELRKLQVGLCRLQDWVKHKGLRVIIVFEGRDAAGKGGTIKAITERVSPRVFRVVAMPAPSDREKTQMFIQRYVQHFPAAGEVVIFDRSWYNRAGVEFVMGFCTEEQHHNFLALCPEIEGYIVDGGIILIKFWLEVGKEEQERRFSARINDPLRKWKLSPMDLESYRLWYQYSKARDLMLKATNSKRAPWHLVRSDDKRRARLNCISHILKTIPPGKMPQPKVKLPKRSEKGRYNDAASLVGKHFVRERY